MSVWTTVLTELTSIPENDFISYAHQRLETLRREFPREEIRVATRVRLPKPANELRRHLRRGIKVRVPVPAPGPVHSRQRKTGAPVRILHGQKRRKVMLLWITRLLRYARKPELPPQPPIPHHNRRMFPGQHEELRPNPEILELYLRQHCILPASRVSVVQVRLVGENLNEAAESKFITVSETR